MLDSTHVARNFRPGDVEYGAGADDLLQVLIQVWF